MIKVYNNKNIKFLKRELIYKILKLLKYFKIKIIKKNLIQF